MRAPLVCDDPIAERRYAYARSAAEEGDWAAAAGKIIRPEKEKPIAERDAPGVRSCAGLLTRA